VAGDVGNRRTLLLKDTRSRGKPTASRAVGRCCWALSTGWKVS